MTRKPICRLPVRLGHQGIRVGMFVRHEQLDSALQPYVHLSETGATLIVSATHEENLSSDDAGLISVVLELHPRANPNLLYYFLITTESQILISMLTSLFDEYSFCIVKFHTN